MSLSIQHLILQSFTQENNLKDRAVTKSITKKVIALKPHFTLQCCFSSFNQYVLDGLIKSCNKTTAGYPFKYYALSLKQRGLQLLVERSQYKYALYVAEF